VVADCTHAVKDDRGVRVLVGKFGSESAGRPIPRRAQAPSVVHVARTDTAASTTYLVEHYRPGLLPHELRELGERVRDSARELERDGTLVRFRRSAVVPADEALLCVLEAPSEDLVRDVCARAGVPFERITVVLPDEGGTPSPTKEER
jgi:hypothetical protein